MKRSGKGASATTPQGAELNPKIGFILAASLPIAAIVFWKITLPFSFQTVSLILGNTLVQRIQFFGLDVWGLMTSPCPPWISAADRAFLEDQSFKQISRMTDLTPDKFEDLVEKGEPFIVSDATKDWSVFGNWSCTSFTKYYPDAEYYDWQGQKSIRLKDMDSRSRYEGLNCASGVLQTNVAENQNYAKEWLSLLPPPYFMDPETWILCLENHGATCFTGHFGTPGTGMSPRVDESCESFLVIQLSGTQLWSLSRPEFDGDELHWGKPIRFYLQPGEVLYFFPGMRQSLEVVEGCSLSFTYRFHMPAPRKYYKELMELLAVSQEETQKLLTAAEVDNIKFLQECNLIEKDDQWNAT